MDETLRNLREISLTVYFNVSTGFEAIANAMMSDALLRKTLPARVQMFFYADASLAQPIWDSLFESEELELGERIVMTTGMGMTESGPFATFVTNHNIKAGDLGRHFLLNFANCTDAATDVSKEAGQFFVCRCCVRQMKIEVPTFEYHFRFTKPVVIWHNQEGRIPYANIVRSSQSHCTRD